MPIIYYLGIIRRDPRPATELVFAKDLSSWSRFTRGSVGEFMTLGAKTLAERVQLGERSLTEEQQYNIHAYCKSTSLCAIMIAEQSYPKNSAQYALNKLIDEFESQHPASEYQNTATTSCPLPNINQYITEWQDINKVDTIANIQRELDETKIVLHKTIESVLERGEKLDSLVQKSDTLSSQSKMFYTTAKKQNSCCIVM